MQTARGTGAVARPSGRPLQRSVVRPPSRSSYRHGFQIPSNAGKGIAPTNLTTSVEIVGSAIARKAILYNSQRCFPGRDRIDREFTGQVRGKRQRSVAGKILEVRKHDPLRRIENAHAAGGDEIGRVFFAPKTDPDSARLGIDNDVRCTPPLADRARRMQQREKRFRISVEDFFVNVFARTYSDPLLRP